MIAEVADMNMLQAVVLRWGERITMREQVEWMSVRWVKDVLKSLDEEEGCLGRRMRSFESVEAKVCTLRSNYFLFDGTIWVARLVQVAGPMTLPTRLLCAL